MQLEAVQRDVSSSGTMQVAKATIKATPKIFDMFANDTYANKPLAIMRELVANGIDAHAMAGCPQRLRHMAPRQTGNARNCCYCHGDMVA